MAYEQYLHWDLQFQICFWDICGFKYIIKIIITE